MILLVEPISKNINMYVPAYPLPLLEIGSFVNANMPGADIRIISLPVDYGLPLTPRGKADIHTEFIGDLSRLKPQAVGISCTAISQAEGVIELCELIKAAHPDGYVFLGGYFPTLYYREVFERTQAVDFIIRGEGELPFLKAAGYLSQGRRIELNGIPGCVWKTNGELTVNEPGKGFDLKLKSPLSLELLRYPRAYDILPYAFSRGCPYQCNFCMEEFMRPIRREVPIGMVERDLRNLLTHASTRRLLISDALFRSFDIFRLLRELGVVVNFETRADVLHPSQLREIADICGALAVGFESASYGTLTRMNKVRDRSHYEEYVRNGEAIFREAVRNDIPVMFFFIAGYPGDTEADLHETLEFARKLSGAEGPGGFIFKIGECRAYPRTKLYRIAKSMPGVEFDDEGVFGDNIVRKPSRTLGFETVLDYMRAVYDLSRPTPKMQQTLLRMMPFFRIPGQSLRDDMVPSECFRDADRQVLKVDAESLSLIRKSIPGLALKYKELASDQRSKRDLSL